MVSFPYFCLFGDNSVLFRYRPVQRPFCIFLMFSIADWFCLTDQLVSQCKFFVKLMCFCVACEPYKLGFFIISMKIVWQWFFLLYLIYWPFNLVDLFFLLSKISNVALYTCTHIDTFISQALCFLFHVHDFSSWNA